MKDLLNKIKTKFQSINLNFNLVIGFLIVVGLLSTTIILTRYFSDRKALKVDEKRIELLTKTIDKSNISQVKKRKITSDIDGIYKNIKENEEVDWSTLYASDPDSVARAVVEWNRLYYNSK
jgi:hypothetical protein